MLAACGGRGGKTGSDGDNLTGDNDPPECGAVCDIYCPYGNIVDENGCETCACNPAPLCQADSDCAMGQVCDTTQCLSPCSGLGGDFACPAVCYGQCVDGNTNNQCDPNAADSCGEGLQCVCYAAAEGRPGSDAPDGSGLIAPPPDGCFCEPVAPPPETCDPTNPVCENGGECICFGYAEPASCDPDGQSCEDRAAPIPMDECYCVIPPPPPPSCDASNPSCPEGSVCECYVADIACAPDSDGCVPPDPVCYCTKPEPPPPPSCDPNNPVCENGGDCVCAVSCGEPCPEGETCPEHEPTCWCTEPPPPPPPTCDPTDANACSDGQVCECYVAETNSDAPITCDPSAPDCGMPPPPSECYCADVVMPEDGR